MNVVSISLKTPKAVFKYMVSVLVTTASRYSYNRRIPRILMSIEPDMKGLLVLDVGCGEGRYSALFDNNMYVGIDIGNYEFRRSLIEDSHFCRARLEKLPFVEGTFDLVFSSFLIEHVGDTMCALTSMRDMLKKRGCLILSTGTKWARLIGEMHCLFWKRSDSSVGQAHHYFDVNDLSNKLERAGFKEIHCHYVGGPFSVAIDLIITFFRLLLMKLRGEKYDHGRDSDETEKGKRVREGGVGHFIWKLTVPLQFCVKCPLCVVSYFLDRLISPLHISRFVVITANLAGK